jgi:uncharacterized protein (DUF1697 family)
MKRSSVTVYPCSYAAFLRGINVGGKNRIKMPDLALLFEALGLGDVKTYIQSGNVAFRSAARDTDTLSALIKTALRERSGLDAEVIVKSRRDIERLVASDPFAGREGLEDGKRYVTLLTAVPSGEAIAGLDDDERIEEEHHLIGDVMYTYYAKGYGRSYFNNNFIERRLGVHATSRVWATILEMARLIASSTLAHVLPLRR